MDDLPVEILKILCEYAVEMVTIRQHACPHLATENIGPEMLERVIRAYVEGLSPPQIVYDAELTRPVQEKL